MQQEFEERMAMSRKLIAAKKAKNFTWSALAATAGVSPFIVAAALHGQMQLPKQAAEKVGAALGINDAEEFLTEIPSRGSLGQAVPTDPTIYRFYEIVQVYGTTLKSMIHDEFGDGIMSAIDFDLDLSREPNPNGDRVKIVMTGKFLKYKKD